MRSTAFAIADDPGPLTEILLHLLAGLTFHPPEGQLGCPTGQEAHKTADRRIAPFKVLFGDQILKNPLDREPGVPGLFNPLTQGLTGLAGPADPVFGVVAGFETPAYLRTVARM